MHLQTTVDIPSYPFDINYQQRMLFIGSCFADNMGKKFSENKFHTLLNPFGVLYNPASIQLALDAIIKESFDSTLMIKHNELWHSFLHHGSFSNTSREQVLDKINSGIATAHSYLQETDLIFITLGTAQVYEYQGNIVANCHKIPAKAFTRRRLSVAEIVERLSQSIHQLKSLKPDIKIVLSVSPVRYPKDGMHLNSLSKASLLLATEDLCQIENCYYFPAYEIVMDELRDYRFFAEDLTHPNQLCINYLWESIEKTFFSRATLQLKQKLQAIVAARQHRPLNTQPAAHKQFLSAMYTKASNLQKQHPEIDLSEELKYFSTK